MQLKCVQIYNIYLDAKNLKPIIKALNTSVKTIEGINFEGTEWNDDEAIVELVNLIAKAPNLEWVCIRGPYVFKYFKLLRQQAENGVNGYVKAIREKTGEGEVICEAETSLST